MIKKIEIVEKIEDHLYNTEEVDEETYKRFFEDELTLALMEEFPGVEVFVNWEGVRGYIEIDDQCDHPLSGEVEDIAQEVYDFGVAMRKASYDEE